MQFKTLKELRSLDDKSLNKELSVATNFLSSLAFEKSQGNVKDTSQLRKTKTFIAWAHTIKSERKNENKPLPQID